MSELETRYRGYIACLNAREWDRLGEFVDERASHNGAAFGLAGYRAMLLADVAAIPDLVFTIDLLLVDPPHVAARLHFDCTPVGALFGLPVNGRRVQFSENVFYRFEAGKIVEVRSVIDTAAIAAQIA
ncbi:SnoaL-like polyketide cyclase [Aquimixticola soesokkakensis]|uniref:SnoaL-like polyketide cyclase n=1 Tax=Aquimixticola soesokkakensis TaxID=1519096 RepID=A0A1Y5SPX4_9RHOB|nr:ester cyclase [Aquimixticola soesokkakensis]SLN42620.1 SnoaL-like polyketide cyclase [Aquimixticola soesokkakensis]